METLGKIFLSYLEALIEPSRTSTLELFRENS